MTRGPLLLSSLFLFATIACREERSPSAPPPGDTAVVASGVSAARPVATSATPAVVAAQARPVDTWLAASPHTRMVHTNPLMLNADKREGMLFGWPKGYRLDNPSRIILYPRGPGPHPRIVIARLGEDDPKGKLLASSEAVGLVKGRWPTPWRSAVATRARYSAIYAEGEGTGLGDGQPRRALAAVIFVPRLGPVGVIGAWPTSRPEARELVADSIRNSELCRWVVGSGCVPESQIKVKSPRSAR